MPKKLHLIGWMNLLVFDIDGTLTQTNRVDTNCYKEAVTATLGEVEFRTTWAEYKNVTDEGVLTEIAEDNEIKIDKQIRNSIKEIFLELLAGAFGKNQPKEVPGGIAFIERLARLDVAFSLATGCWRDSALLKLSKTGYKINANLISSSDDDIRRENIMLYSLEKAKQYYKLETIKEIYYFGDNSYDFEACEKLGWEFVGIGEKVEELCQFNQRKWFDNYLGEIVVKEFAI